MALNTTQHILDQLFRRWALAIPSSQHNSANVQLCHGNVPSSLRDSVFISEKWVVVNKPCILLDGLRESAIAGFLLVFHPAKCTLDWLWLLNCMNFHAPQKALCLFPYCPVAILHIKKHMENNVQRVCYAIYVVLMCVFWLARLDILQAAKIPRFTQIFGKILNELYSFHNVYDTHATRRHTLSQLAVHNAEESS